jgi:hypothetical protein
VSSWTSAKARGEEMQKKCSLAIRMTIVKTLTLTAFVMARRRGFRKAFFTFLIGSYWICPELPAAIVKSNVKWVIGK